jgi:hypothetical protein
MLLNFKQLSFENHEGEVRVRLRVRVSRVVMTRFDVTQGSFQMALIVVASNSIPVI